jgi:hypothetical protein
MSDPGARSISWVTFAVVFAGLALFAAVVARYYEPRPATMPYNLASEQLPAELAWKATPEARAAYRAELQQQQGAEAAKYAWIDEPKGVVQLPLERAKELTIRELNARPRR